MGLRSKRSVCIDVFIGIVRHLLAPGGADILAAVDECVK